MTDLPLIDPTTFDLILVGTGLPQSIIAAAASASGKSVLHVDPNSFYGSHFGSLPLTDLTTFLNSTSSPLDTPSPSPSNGDDHSVVNLTARPLYSSIQISNFAPDLIDQCASKFLLDLSGPRVLFCADKSIDLIIKSGAGNYLEFKSVDASFIGDENGKLHSVPDSRSAIFKDKSLSLLEKNQLMRFFKLVQAHLAAVSAGEESSSDFDGNASEGRVSEEDLESPFVDFLTKMRLPPKIKSCEIVLYAIAMADYDQNTISSCKDVIKTKDGIERLAQYQSSIGRFANALGALIYPMYGQGELPQAFCRRAAVKGCIHVLRMPVGALLMDKNSGSYKGVKLSSGQDIFSDKLVLDPSFTISSPSPSQSGSLHEHFDFLTMRDVKENVARGICITRSSLKPDMSNLLIVYPPRSLYHEQVTSIRILQIGSNVAVCPSGMFVVYLAALCDDADQGKKLLNAAINAFFTTPDSLNSETSSTVQSEDTEALKPTLLWSMLYIQELNVGHFGSIISTPIPDGNLDYCGLIDAAAKVFQNMYPNEEYFPETTSPDNLEDDSELSLDT